MNYLFAKSAEKREVLMEVEPGMVGVFFHFFHTGLNY